MVVNSAPVAIPISTANVPTELLRQDTERLERIPEIKATNDSHSSSNQLDQNNQQTSNEQTVERKQEEQQGQGQQNPQQDNNQEQNVSAESFSDESELNVSPQENEVARYRQDQPRQGENRASFQNTLIQRIRATGVEPSIELGHVISLRV